MLNLEGVAAKTRRASDGLRSLESDIAAHCDWERQELIATLVHCTQETLNGDEPQLLVDFAIRIGEIAYNLRSALDHLIWAVAAEHQVTLSRHHEFPIFRSEAQYRRAAQRKLSGLPAEYTHAIEAVQPFLSDSPTGRDLWMLQLVCNIDKHRHLNVVNTHSIANAYIEAGAVPSELVHGIESGLALLTYLKGTPYERFIRLDVVVDVCFRDTELTESNPGYGSLVESEGITRPPVGPMLLGCLRAVEDVIKRIGLLDD